MNTVVRQKVLNAYKQTGLESMVLSATPHKRVSMLYEGAIRHANLAKMAINRKDIAAKALHSGKAMDIISGLRSVLNHEQGGQLAQQLDALYDFMLRHLLEANKENSEAKFNTVIELLTTLKEGWDGMPEEYKNLDDQALSKLRTKAS